MTRHTIHAFCEEHLEDVKEQRGELTATCPKCGKKKKHFSINLDTGLWNCFRCGASGNFRQLVKVVTGRYINDKRLEEEYVSELTLDTLKEIFAENPEVSIDCIGDWKLDTCPIKTKGRLPKQARDYLMNRGVSTDLADSLQFRVGITGKYMGRIIMPVIEDGVVKNFVARTFMDNPKRYAGPHKYEPYVNKSELLWNWDNVKYGGEVILVEGIFDAIPLLDLNIAALMGKTISVTQTDKVLDKASSVVILLDGGFNQDAQRIAKVFLGLVPVKVAEMSQGDPSEFPELARIAIEKAKDFYSC